MVPDLQHIIRPPDEVVQAAQSGNLVLFIGAGVSRLLGLPSWRELAGKVLEDMRDNSLLNYSEVEQLKTQEPKKQLSIAEVIADQNNFNFNHAIVQHLDGKTEGDSVYKAINNIGCFCVTTNYDKLLAPRYQVTADGSTTSPDTKRVFKREEILAKLLNEPGTVVHLHGCIDDPNTMVVTTKNYLEHYDQANVQNFLDEMFSQKTVVFLGYDLEEAEILEHILRRGKVKNTEDRRRFVVQGFFHSECPLYEKLYNYYKKSFGVYLLGFIRDDKDYRGLEDTMKSWVSEIKVQEPHLVDEVHHMDNILDNE